MFNFTHNASTMRPPSIAPPCPWRVRSPPCHGTCVCTRTTSQCEPLWRQGGPTGASPAPFSSLSHRLTALQETTPNGSLLAVSGGSTSCADGSHGYGVLARLSPDKGKTWGPIRCGSRAARRGYSLLSKVFKFVNTIIYSSTTTNRF